MDVNWIQIKENKETYNLHTGIKSCPSSSDYLLQFNGSSNNLKNGISVADKPRQNYPIPQVFLADFVKHKHEATLVTLANEICPIARNEC